jgi:hypothetical protein
MIAGYEEQKRPGPNHQHSFRSLLFLSRLWFLSHSPSESVLLLRLRFRVCLLALFVDTAVLHGDTCHKATSKWQTESSGRVRSDSTGSP